MSNLYQYLKENFKENEPIILTELQIEGMTGNNIRQQLKKLTDAGTTFREKVYLNQDLCLALRKYWSINIFGIKISFVDI